MTRFLEPSFSVGGHKAPPGCKHGFIDVRGYCFFCGDYRGRVEPIEPAVKKEPSDEPRTTEAL